MQGLTQMHYSPLAVNDQFDDRIYDLWLKRVDYSKKFLTQADVNQLSKMKDDIDDELKTGDRVRRKTISGTIMLMR